MKGQECPLERGGDCATPSSSGFPREGAGLSREQGLDFPGNRDWILQGRVWVAQGRVWVAQGRGWELEQPSMEAGPEDREGRASIPHPIPLESHWKVLRGLEKQSWG